jgi:hypothetical protein
MAESSSTSLITGLTVALFGLLPLGVVLTGSHQQEQQAVLAITTTIAEPVTTQVEIDPPDVEGLDPRLTRVLYANGSADGVEVGSTEELPEPIVKVLGYYGVTLTVDVSGVQP